MSRFQGMQGAGGMDKFEKHLDQGGTAGLGAQLFQGAGQDQLALVHQAKAVAKALRFLQAMRAVVNTTALPSLRRCSTNSTTTWSAQHIQAQGRLVEQQHGRIVDAARGPTGHVVFVLC